MLLLRDDGSILLLVLVLVAVLVGMCLSIAEVSMDRYSAVHDLYVSNQAAYYAYSAVKVVKRLLQDDDRGYDWRGDTWYGTYTIPVENGVVQVSVEPLNRKLSLHLLISKDEDIASRAGEAFSKLFDESGMSSTELDEIKGILKKRKIHTLKELNYALGKDVACKLAAFASVAGGDKVNINFASGELIEAWVPEISGCLEAIEQNREKVPIRDISELKNWNCLDEDTYVKVQRFITTRSSVFLVKVSVVMGDVEKRFNVIMERGVAGRIRIVGYYEGNGCYE